MIFGALTPFTVHLSDDLIAIIDWSDFEEIRRYSWRAIRKQKSAYAGAITGSGPTYRMIWMHRLIAKTPFGQICHHRNRNGLDNRRANLMNMDKKDHQHLHQNNSLIIRTDGSFVPLF